MEFHHSDHFGEAVLPDAYEWLLLDAIHGDAPLFARSDEVEQAWALVDPILDEWEQEKAPPLAIYEPGSWGPTEADEFIMESHCIWHLGCTERGVKG